MASDENPNLQPATGPIIHLACGGSTADICVFGAHVLSWKPSLGEKREELLYMSSLAKFEEDKVALRGGIPLCWPAFADRNKKVGKHGFLRTSTEWRVAERSGEAGKVDRVTLELRTSHSRCVGNAVDEKELITVRAEFVLLPTKLGIEMKVENRATEALPFSGCLHTYFAKEREEVEVRGFGSFRRTQELGNVWENSDDVVHVSGAIEVERMFIGDKGFLSCDSTAMPIFGDSSSSECFSFSPMEGVRVKGRSSTSFPDTVVWNIGENAPEKFPKDMERSDSKRYLCVEPAVGVSGEDAIVAAGETWRGWHILEAEAKDDSEEKKLTS